MGNVSGKKEETESPGSLKNEDEYEEGEEGEEETESPGSLKNEDEYEEGEEEYMEYAPFPEFTPQSRSPLFFSPRVPLIPSERTEGNVMVEHAEMAIDNGIPTIYQVPLIPSERTEGISIVSPQKYFLHTSIPGGERRVLQKFLCKKNGQEEEQKKVVEDGFNIMIGSRKYCWSEKEISLFACLAKAFGSIVNLVATCLHSREMLPKKHWTSVKEVEEIEARRGSILYEVDVYIMNRHPHLLGFKFDIIIFNFPHAGHFSGLCERDKKLILKHRKLIKAYFRTAKEMLKEGGEIHITLRQDPPYDSWDVEELARNAGLHLKEKVAFVQANYPGYHNKRGGNINCNKKFPLSCCFTLKYTLLSKGGSVESVLTTLKKLQI